jgi:hypothetical protein
MTEENKQQTETKEEDVPRGERGELGVATPSHAIKLLWHEEHFILQNVGDKHNPRKQAWVRRAGAPSLRKYARQLAASGNQVAKDWLDNKSGAQNAERQDKNKTRISLEKQASRAARRKRSQKDSVKKPADAKTVDVDAAKVLAKAK